MFIIIIEAVCIIIIKMKNSNWYVVVFFVEKIAYIMKNDICSSVDVVNYRAAGDGAVVVANYQQLSMPRRRRTTLRRSLNNILLLHTFVCHIGRLLQNLSRHTTARTIATPMHERCVCCKERESTRVGRSEYFNTKLMIKSTSTYQNTLILNHSLIVLLTLESSRLVLVPAN